jgi:sugar lactone lactonase YvrE
MKSAMDGNYSSITTIVSGKRNVYWPNGITIDHRDMKIYWTDSQLERISSAYLDGSGIKQIVRGTYLVPSIADFMILWLVCDQSVQYIHL